MRLGISSFTFGWAVAQAADARGHLGPLDLLARRCPPPLYEWADPRYAVVHASIVDCARNLLQSLQGRGAAETTGEDNLRTLGLVYGAYRSAREGRALNEGELELAPRRKHTGRDSNATTSGE